MERRPNQVDSAKNKDVVNSFMLVFMSVNRISQRFVKWSVLSLRKNWLDFRGDQERYANKIKLVCITLCTGKRSQRSYDEHWDKTAWVLHA